MGHRPRFGRAVIPIAVLNAWLLAASLGLVALHIHDPASKVDRQFEAALAQGDLDAAWALLRGGSSPTEVAPGRAQVLHREHFDAAFRDAVPTGERSVSSPIYRWPGGREHIVMLTGEPGNAIISPIVSFYLVVYTEESPVLTRVDGVEIRGSYTDQSWARGWLLNVTHWHSGAPLHVEVEFADGHSLAVTTMPRPIYVQVMRDPDRIYATTGPMLYPEECVGLRCPLISNRRLDDSRLEE